MKTHLFGLFHHATDDGRLVPEGVALIETAYGSRRFLEMPIEEQLPRIS